MSPSKGPTLRELAVQALSSTERGYDLIAPKFEQTPFRTPDVLLSEVSRVIQEFGGASSAIDLCCGTGAGLSMLAPLVRDRLVGLDFSQGMLEEAQRRLDAQPEGMCPVEYVRADIFNAQLDHPFELATCFGAFGHILEEDESRFVRVVHRLLAPGGRFVFITNLEPSLFDLRAMPLRIFNGVMRARNALISPPFIMYYLTFQLPRAQRLLEDAGFDVEVIQPSPHRPWRQLRIVVATRRD